MDGKIVPPVANFDFTIDDLSSIAQTELYTYWLKIKADKLMPSRDDFAPTDLPKILPFISMENVVYDPVRFQIRLVGTQTSSLRNSVGMFLDDIPGTEHIISMLKEMVELKKPYFYTSNINWDERKYKTYSSLILPFSEDGENVTLCMACHHSLGVSRY